MTDGTAAAPGAGAPLVDDVRAAAAAERLRIRLFEDGRERPDAETLAPGVELAAHRIERGQPGFHAVALGIAATLGADPVRLRVFLRGWYEGARGLLEDNGRPTDALDSPEAVRAALQALTGFDDRAPLAPSPAPRPAAAPSPALRPESPTEAARPGGFDMLADPRRGGPGAAPAPSPAPAPRAEAPRHDPAETAPEPFPRDEPEAPASLPSPAGDARARRLAEGAAHGATGEGRSARGGLLAALEAAEDVARAGREETPLADPEAEPEAPISDEDYARYTGAGRRVRREKRRKVAVRRSDMLWGALFAPVVMGGFSALLLVLVMPPISWATGLSRWQVMPGLEVMGLAISLWMIASLLLLPPIWFVLNRGWRIWIWAPPVIAAATALMAFLTAFIQTRSVGHPEFIGVLRDWVMLWGGVMAVCGASIALGPFLRRFNRRAFRRLGNWWDKRFGGGKR